MYALDTGHSSERNTTTIRRAAGTSGAPSRPTTESFRHQRGASGGPPAAAAARDMARNASAAAGRTRDNFGFALTPFAVSSAAGHYGALTYVWIARAGI